MIKYHCMRGKEAEQTRHSKQPLKHSDNKHNEATDTVNVHANIYHLMEREREYIMYMTSSMALISLELKSMLSLCCDSLSAPPLRIGVLGVLLACASSATA